MARRIWWLRTRLLSWGAQLENTGCACPADSSCPHADLRALATALGVAYPPRHRPVGCLERVR